MRRDKHRSIVMLSGVLRLLCPTYTCSCSCVMMCEALCATTVRSKPVLRNALAHGTLTSPFPRHVQVAGLGRLWMPDWVGCCLFRLDPEQGFVTLPQPWYPLSYTAGMHALQAGSAFIATNHYRGQCASRSHARPGWPKSRTHTTIVA